MQRHLDRLATILELHLAHVEQELGQLIGPGGQGLDLLQCCRLVLEQVGIVFPEHAGAGTGRHHYRIIAGKQRQLRAGYLACLFGIAAGVGRLPTAALPLRVFDANAFALEQVNRIHARFGVEQVDDTGTEQIHPLRFLAGVLARLRQWRCDAGGIRHGVVKKLAHQAFLRVVPVIRIACC
ncbi:hypothetical protein D3C80_1201310 [compost metagenome]